MSVFLNATGRPIVFSCSFPAYQGLSVSTELKLIYVELNLNGLGELFSCCGVLQFMAKLWRY